ILGVIKSAHRRTPIFLRTKARAVLSARTRFEAKAQTFVSRRGRHHQTGIRRAESDLAESDAFKRLVRGLPYPRDLGPCRPSICGQQNSESVVRIGRIIRLPGSDQNNVAVSRLQSNCANRQRRLIVNQRLPDDRSRTGIGIGTKTSRIGRSPKTAICPAQQHRVATGVRGIDQHRSSPPRDPVVILPSIAGSIGSQWSRSNGGPNRRARTGWTCCRCAAQALLGWVFGGRCGRGDSRRAPRPHCHFLLVSPKPQSRRRFPRHSPSALVPVPIQLITPINTIPVAYYNLRSTGIFPFG